MKQSKRVVIKNCLIILWVCVLTFGAFLPSSLVLQDFVDSLRHGYIGYKKRPLLITTIGSRRGPCIRAYTAYLNAYYRSHRSYPERLPALPDEAPTQRVPCGAKAFNVLDERESVKVVYSKYSQDLETRFARCREALLYYTYAQQQGFGLTLCSSTGDWSTSLVYGVSFYQGEQIKEDSPWPILDVKKGRVYDYGHLAQNTPEINAIHNTLMKEIEKEPERFFSYSSYAWWYQGKTYYPQVW